MKATFLIAGVCLAASVSLLATRQTSVTTSSSSQSSGPPNQAQPPTGTSALSGVVIDGSTGAPVEDAIVNLSGRNNIGGPGAQNRQMTDAKGRFAFVDLPASTSYTVTANKFGYLDGAFGRDTAGAGPSAPIAVRDGDWLQDLKVSLWRPGSISGAVIDENGEPVVGVFVRVLMRLRIQGRDELAAGQLTTTDDRGVYRISGLGPGRYLVEVPSVQAAMPSSTPYGSSAAPGISATLDMFGTTKLALSRYPLPPTPLDGHPRAYPITFAPGARTPADATPIELHAADDRINVDVKIEPVSTARVSGVVDGPPEALASLTLRLLLAGLDSLSNGSEVATTFVASDGSFTFLNVPAGAYILDAPRNSSEFTAPGAPSFGSGPNFPTPPGRNGSSSTGTNVDAAPPGTTFTTKNFRGAEPNYWGRAAVTVNGSDESGLVVRMRPTGTMSGRVVADNDPSQPAPAQPPSPTSVLLDPATGSPGLGLVRNPQQGGGPGEFSLTGLLAGEYLVRFAGSSTWVVKSVTWGGRDYTSTPFDAAATVDFNNVVVTVTNAVQAITGTVRVEQGASTGVAAGSNQGPATSPSLNAAVIVFPVDRARWTKYGLMPTWFKSTTPSSSGSYRLGGMPAGDYYVIAVESSMRTAWQDPEFLGRAALSATRVSIGWGETKTIDLTKLEVR